MNVKCLIIAAIIVVFLSVVAPQVRDTRAATTRNFTLYGSALHGWGFTSTNITSPGPTIIVEQGDTVNLTLISNDGAQHLFFVSYTNSTSPSSGDPQSASFTGTTHYNFTANDTVGTYMYRCSIHPSVMYGFFQILPTGTIPEFQLIIMVPMLVAGTTLAALMYRRKK